MTSKCDQNLRKKYKVTNWAEYNKALKNRGDITLWITEEAISSWTPAKNGKRGRQFKYSDLATETATTIRLIFAKRLQQTEGFLYSIIKLMGLDLPIPDHTTISRRMRKIKIKKEERVQDGPLNIELNRYAVTYHSYFCD